MKIFENQDVAEHIQNTDLTNRNVVEDTLQINANDPQQSHIVMLAPLFSYHDVELKRMLSSIYDMDLVLLSSEPSNCLKSMFQNFQRQCIKARWNVKSRITSNAQILNVVQNDYDDSENQEYENKNAFYFLKQF